MEAVLPTLPTSDAAEIENVAPLIQRTAITSPVFADRLGVDEVQIEAVFEDRSKEK